MMDRSLSTGGDTTTSLIKRTEGYLYKKGGAVNKGIGGRRNWLKRWFVLEKISARNGKDSYHLHYFESQKGKQKGSVDLDGTEVFCERKSQHTNKNVKYEFQIQLQNGSLLYLSCDDFHERDEWIESINYAITSMRKPVVERPAFVNKASHAGYDPNLDDVEENYILGREIAQHCQAYGSGLYGAEAGQPAEFMIQVCDPDGNQLTTGGLPFTANLYDDTCLYHIGVHDNQNGTLSAFYIISRPGHYELSILLNDEHHIYGSPFNVEVMPSHTDPSCCMAFGECIQKMIVPEVPSTFTIVAMDSYGNKKQRGGDPFEVGVMGPAKLLSLEDKADGTYVCTLEASSPRDQPFVTSSAISIIITLNGKPIQGSPFRPVIDLSSRSNPTSRLQQGADQRIQLNRSGPPSSLPRPQNFEKEAPASIPKPPLNIPPGTNKLEAARMRALEAAKDLPSNPQDQPRVPQDRDRAGYESSGGSQASRQRTSTTSLNFAGNRNGLNEPTIEEKPTTRDQPSIAVSTPPPSASANAKLSNRISRLDQMAQKLGTSKLLNSQNNQKAGGYRAGIPPPPPPTEIIDALSAGLVIPPPDDLPNELRRLWNVTHEALRSREIINLLASNTVALQSSFNIAAEPPAYRLSFLLSETGQSSGLYKLFEEFDVIPAYMSKKELKLLYELIIRSQAHSGPPPASFISSQGKEGIEFIYFLKLIFLVSIYCLSKTTAFNSLYSTPKAKADVMLFNWGFADPLKIKNVSDRLKRD